MGFGLHSNTDFRAGSCFGNPEISDCLEDTIQDSWSYAAECDGQTMLHATS